jgi:segregation and condensation protein B
VKVTQIVEAVLFASDAPLKAEEIARADAALDEDVVEEAVRTLQNEYAETERSFQLVELAEGYQILTRGDFAPDLERFDTIPKPSRLSGPSLETLAIIAYRQPIGRIEIEYVRGVACGGVIRTLQDRGIVDVVGRAEGLGRPLLYGTTQKFLDHFGFRSIEDLPRPEELPIVLRERIPLGAEEIVADKAAALEGTSNAKLKGAEEPAADAPAPDSTQTELDVAGEPAAEEAVGEEPVHG